MGSIVGQPSGAFSLTCALINEILVKAKPMGHHEDLQSLNLGFGFLYYGLARTLRPEHTLVIGSGYGFTVVCLGLALKDNGRGRLTFVDPSYSLAGDGPFKTVGGRGMWNDPEKVHEHFRQFGVEGVTTHYRMESAAFFDAYGETGLPRIDLALIDGNHSFTHVRDDFLRVLERSRKNTYIFLHDTNIYIRELIRHAGVKRWLKLVARERELFEVINFPFSSGVALVRVKRETMWMLEP